MIKKRNTIISVAASTVRIKNMKYSMKIPTSIRDDYDIDRGNGNTVCRDAIKREMENVSVACEVQEDGKKQSSAPKQVSFFIIYDIKMDLTRKAILVAEESRTPNPVTSTYAGVVSR